MSQYDDLFEEVEDKPKRKRNEDPTTWAEVWKALGIFAGTIILVWIFAWVVQNLFFKEIFDTYLDMTVRASVTPELEGMMSSYADSLDNPIFLGIFSIIAMGFIFFTLFLVYGTIHLWATKVQGGIGGFRGLIVRANPVTSGVYLLYSIVINIALAVIAINVVNRFEGVDISASFESMTEFNNALQLQSRASSMVFLVFALTWSIGAGFAVAKNYQMSKTKGCLTILISNISLFALSCGCMFAVGFGVAGFMLSA